MSLAADTPHDPSHVTDGVRHHATVTAEVRKLRNTLLAFGPMSPDTLGRVVGAKRWHEGSFEEAVREGVDHGQLVELPFGWLKANQAP